MKKPAKKIVSNYLNDAFLMPTPAQILPVTVLSQESVFYPIPQGCFDQTPRKRCQYFFSSRRSNDQPIKTHLSLFPGHMRTWTVRGSL